MQKLRLNFWHIWNMSAIYGYLGATADSLAILWLGALLTLLVVSVRRTGAELLPVSGGGGH